MALVLVLAATLALLRQGAQPVPTPADIEREVLENVKRQPLGEGTVDDLALPDEFLRRIADRIVRSSFEERYRIVVADSGPTPRDAEATSTTSSTALLAAGLLALGGLAWVLVARRRDRSAA